MRNSRSIASASSAWLWALVAAAAVMLGGPGAAQARKRIAVLEFSGPKAEDFQEDVEKLLKKKHSVVPQEKWDKAADAAKVTKLSAAGIKKVAAAINLDGVLTGKTEKRGSKYYLHLTLYAGATGKVDTKSDIVERNPGLGEDGRNDVTTMLLPAIEDLPALGGDDDDDEDQDADREDDDRGKGRGRGFGKPRGDDDEEEDDDEDDDRADDRGRDRGKGRDRGRDQGRGDEDEEDDDRRNGRADDDDDDRDDDRGRGRGKAKDDEDDDEDGDDEDDDRVAALDDDDDRDRDDDDDDDRDRGRDRDDDFGGTPDPRPAMDVAAGLSFTGRKLGFTTNLAQNAPQGYSGSPVPGLRVTVDAYPLAFNKRNRSFTRNLGITALFDRAIKITSELKTATMTYALPTTEQHLAIGVIYRHPVSATLTVRGSLRYNKRKFFIAKGGAPADAVDIPNTDYTYVDPGLGVHYVLGPKASLGADARFLLITNTGEMQSPTQYGASTVTGVDLALSVDYKLTAKVILRGAAGLATIGYAFKGNGALTNNRDGDPNDVDVSGARDTYFGGSAGAAYHF